ncbi:putative protein phosphatase 2C 53 isoform X1 [Magnolia sinica]|nr:putative protein phosphatase 2C 53 isoform X1 [Magnolia sinica]
MKIMSYTVGVKGSPAFSPSRTPLLTKTSSSSPKTSPSSLSPSSSFRLRFLQKQASSLSRKDASIVAVDPSHSPPPPPPPSMSLKRKRPTRINIPDLNSLSLTLPIASEGVKEVEIKGKQFSVFCKKGIREAMEDRHAAVVDLHDDPKQAFFGVFDGHGGVKAAEFATENMGKKIMDEVMKSGGDGIKAAIRSAYLATDSEFLKEGTRGGACCVTALIKNSDLIVSNAGDCRAVLSRGGVAESLTDDHRPSREDERDRIENLGGYVDCCRGVWRLQGSLAVSRGIGDSHLKQWVTAEPETKILRIKPDCEFLILASDGLWDKVSNQEAVDIARSGCLKTDEVSMLSACKNLVDLSVLRGSIDDVSVVIIQLGHFI